MRAGERGNVIMMLFGAVAMLGVVVAGTASYVQGPLSTTVKVTRASMAEGQIHIAARLAVLDSAEDPGDCDDDGFIEPKGYIEAAPGQPFPAGGGHMPMVGAAQSDPWGTPYGYCAWDMGQINDICPGNRREGPGMHETDLEQQSRPVLAIISAGSDRTFDTECLDYNPSHPDGPDQRLVVTPPGSEDIVFTYTYAEARGASAGLWQLKPGDPTIATIDRDVEIGTGRLRFGTEDLWGGTLGDLNVALACDSPQHVNTMRFNPFENTIEVCKDTPSWGWQAVTGGEGGSGSSLSMIPGFPDAINCRWDNSGTWDDLFLYVAIKNNDDIFYRSHTGDARIDFNLDGSFAGTMNMGSLTIECDGKSIADLYEEGNAFNFVGGPGDSLFEGLVAYWPLDESDGETAHDVMGGNDGTLVNMDVPDAWGDGMVGGALRFDGANDYVTVANDPALEGMSGLTLSAWINSESDGQAFGSRILSKSIGAGLDDYEISVHPDNTIRFRVTTDSGRVDHNSDMTIQPGNWYHIAATWDGSVMRIYINGVQDPNTSSQSGQLEASGLALGIGTHLTAPGDRRFHGFIDDVRIYDRALSPLEIYRLFTQPGEGAGGGGLWSLHDNGDDIYYTDGNVGIGTEEPQTALDVAGIIRTSDRVRLSGITGLDAPANTTVSGGGGSGDGLWQESDDDIYYVSGNVGIGTSAPESMLDIAGGIRLGDDSDDCVAGKTGAIRFNQTHSAFEVCRDASEGWIPVSHSEEFPNVFFSTEYADAQEVLEGGFPWPTDASLPVFGKTDGGRTVIGAHTPNSGLTSGVFNHGTFSTFFGSTYNVGSPLWAGMQVRDSSALRFYLDGLQLMSLHWNELRLHNISRVQLPALDSAPTPCPSVGAMNYLASIAMTTDGTLCTCTSSGWRNAANTAACSW